MELSRLLLIAAVCAVAVSAAPSRFKLTPGRYNTTSGPRNDKLNVHVVCHTHDDVGWLKTVDEYFMGANNSIQNAGVQYILDSVMLALSENPDRKFIYVEIAFFKRWWDEQSDAKKDQVRQFVKNGQLEFINAGWCMSDEAAPFYVDMVDQETIGHQFLLREFGGDVVVKTGWQIDPFGHSSFMATLYALMGFNSWFFARSDYQDWNTRAPIKNLETIMRPSASLGDAVNIFTGALPGYGPPDGYDFDYDSGDAPINDDPRLEGVNVDDRVDGFVKWCQDLSNIYRTNNIMLTMGSDFNYLNANTWFKNLDKLIHYTNLDGRVNAFYSTPTEYTTAKYNANLTWSTKEDDYFPYADSPHAFWTGYFTSRPAIKGYVRSRSNYLQACRQLELQFDTVARSQQLWEDLGLAQHHDAVSGTEKQHVANDYARHLSEGTAACRGVLDEGLNKLLGGDALTFAECPYLNQSICPATTAGSSFAVVAYNDLAQARTEWVRLPVPAGRRLSVYDSAGAAVSVSLTPVPGQPALATAVFPITVPPLGHSTAFVVFTGEGAQPAAAEPASRTEDTASISNSLYVVTFDTSSGLVASVTDLRSNTTTKVSQAWGWYNASDGNVPERDNRGQASGAYIFRPNCTENVPTPCRPFSVASGPAALTFTRTANVQEAVQVFAPWLQQTVRLYAGGDAIEVEYTVGPIPFQDGLGKEIVSVWSTDMDTKNTWYTDSNGRDMQKRVFNFRPTWKLNVTDPVSGNYYPVDSSIYAVEPGTRRLTIVTDRAQGGASLFNGELELMVHRRLLHDDSRGVGEPLNETGTTGLGLVITGTHRVILSSPGAAPALHRAHVERLNFPLLLSFTPLSGSVGAFVANHHTTSAGLKAPLPASIHLLTAMDNSYYGAAGSMILRLAHLFEAGEDPVLSQPVTVQLDQLFTRVNVAACTETIVTADQKLSDVHRYDWQTQAAPRASPPAASAPNDLTVVVHPMEIRTWVCSYTLV